MPKFEGCAEAKEISLIPVKRGGGANQHAHVLMRKSAVTPTAPDPQVENDPMSLTAADVQKAALAMTNKVLAMNEVTKAHYLALPEAAQGAFMEKSADDQRVEAETAKAAADAAIALAEAAKSGKTVEFVALEKSNSELRAEIEILKGQRKDDEIEKRAASEFAGYPGGVAAVVPLLKAYAGLSADVRLASEAVLKAQCATSAAALVALGGRSEEEVSKSASAKARIDAKAAEVAKAQNIPLDDAFIAVTEMAEFAADAAAL